MRSQILLLLSTVLFALSSVAIPDVSYIVDMDAIEEKVNETIRDQGLIIRKEFFSNQAYLEGLLNDVKEEVEEIAQRSGSALPA